MAGVEDTKNSFNFKNNFSSLTTTLKVPEDLIGVSSLDEMTNVSQDVWKDWTATKTWLQMCLELKEALKNGTSSKDSLFVIDPLEGATVDNSESAYLLSEPSNRKNKLVFNFLCVFKISDISGQKSPPQTEVGSLRNLHGIFYELHNPFV